MIKISVNPSYFTEVARYVQKYERYPDGEYDSYEYREFWDEEERRCLNGYEVGGLRITGYHYWYLNHWPITLTRTVDSGKLYGEVFKNKRVRGSREFNFPDFWDVDLEFFTELDLAIENGQHMIVLKPRGTGFSYKGSGIAGRNFFLKPRSKNFLVGDSKEFLLGDGLLTKWLDGRNFLMKLHPEFTAEDKIFLNPFGKWSDFKKDRNGMHYVASSDIDGQEMGYMSELLGITLEGDTDKVRGKRGEIIELEEMGAMRKAEVAFNVLRSNVEQGKTIFGTILGFGTGGTVATVFGDMEKIVYNPQAYNVRCYPNNWDEGMQNTFISYFTPAYRNIDFKDKWGNSIESEAREHIQSERDKAAKSADQNALIQVKAEHPFTPQEAILRTTSTVLPSAEARDWNNKMQGLGLHKLGVCGRIARDPEIGLHFITTATDPNIPPPIHEFPHNVMGDLTGCVVQYFAPYRVAGLVPDNLYIIALDPYAFDQSTDSNSIGAAYVYMQANNLVPPGDRIVATYFGRPRTLDDFNKVLFDLAEYYNAKIGFENDRGNTIDYAKRHKKLDWLADEFELAFDADLPKSKTKRGFGMSISSGKESIRKNKGDIYLRDWLIGERQQNEDGTMRLNLHTIYCPATLKEIDLYRSDGGNYDRISALRILMYHAKELTYKDAQPTSRKYTRVKGEDFWTRRHFQN